MTSNNPPDVLLELTFEEAAFLKENCEANLRVGLAALQGCSDRAAAEKLVNLNEKFKGLRVKLIKAGVA